MRCKLNMLRVEAHATCPGKEFQNLRPEKQKKQTKKIVAEGTSRTELCVVKCRSVKKYFMLDTSCSIVCSFTTFKLTSKVRRCETPLIQ